MKLNLGCGDQIMEGYINCDLYDEKAEVKCNVKQLPFEDNSAENIYASHIIEHFDYYEGVKQDFENYCLCVKDGGYIAFHDICDGYYTNKDCDVDILWKELREVFPSWEFIDNNEYKFSPAIS